MKTIILILFTSTCLLAKSASNADDPYDFSLTLWNDIEMGNGQIYAATSDGLMVYDTVTGNYNFYRDEKFHNLTAVAVSDDHSIFVGSNENGGIAIFDGVSFIPLENHESETNNVTKLYWSDGLWIGSSSGLCFYDGELWKNFDIPLLKAENLWISTICSDNDSDRVYFGISGEDGSKECMHIGYIENKQTCNMINCITSGINDLLVKSSDNLIIASKMEVFEMQINNNTILTEYIYPPYSYPLEYRIAKFHDDDLWLVDNRQFDIYHLNSNNHYNLSNTYRIPIYWDEDYIKDVIFTDSLIWFITEKSGLYSLYINGDDVLIKNYVSQYHSGTPNINNMQEKEKVKYNLSGNKITSPKKGEYYIENGKIRVR